LSFIGTDSLMFVAELSMYEVLYSDENILILLYSDENIHHTPQAREPSESSASLRMSHR
jgi:hypothetical protein